MAGQVLVYYYHNNLAFGNFYTLAEFLILLLFFHKWASPEKKTEELAVLSLGITIWISDNLIWHKPGDSTALFRIAYSLIVTWKSAILLSRLVVQKGSLSAKDPLILVMFSLLLYFSFKAFIQVFLLAGALFTPHFRTSIYLIHTAINLVANILYAIVFLCMPKKQTFSISSS